MIRKFLSSGREHRPILAGLRMRYFLKSYLYSQSSSTRHQKTAPDVVLAKPDFCVKSSFPETLKDKQDNVCNYIGRSLWYSQMCSFVRAAVTKSTDEMASTTEFYFHTVLGGRSLRSRRRQVWFPVRPLLGLQMATFALWSPMSFSPLCFSKGPF